MSGAGSASRASRIGPARRAEIFDATIELVIAHGYESVTMDAVAVASRASKATLYRQWQDKATLVVTAVAERSGIRLDEIDTGTLQGDLETLMRVLARRAEQNTPLALALVHAARHDTQLREVLDRFLLPQLPLFDAIIERAMERGEVSDAARAGDLREMIIGALFAPLILGVADAADEHSLLGYTRRVIIPVLRTEGARRPTG